MKKLYLIILIFFLLSFTGCSINNSPFSNSNLVNQKVQDLTGNGLEVSLNFDSTDILSKKVYYSINIKNTGKDKISLNKKNFRFLTIQKSNDGSNVFTQNSIESFYSNLFGKGDLVLNQNQVINGISGVLNIKSNFFKDVNHKDIDSSLLINYDYKTHFSNNIQLNLNGKLNSKFKLLDTLSQAAPVGISSIKFKPTINKNQYLLVFELVSKNSFGNNPLITFKSYDLIFKREHLSNCKYFLKLDGNDKEINFENFILNDKTNTLILKCLVNLDSLNNQGIINSQISGEFSYNYQNELKNRIQLPKTRNLGGWN